MRLYSVKQDMEGDTILHHPPGIGLSDSLFLNSAELKGKYTYILSRFTMLWDVD